MSRYTRVIAGVPGRSNERTEVNTTQILKDVGLAVGVFIFMIMVWPFYSVPVGSRGVVTQFGKIIGIEQEGLAVLPPWRKLALFSIRAEQADVDKADGATSDTQPVAVSLTVRYSIMPDKVAEVFEKYSHNGDLSSYVQTATHEIFKAVTAKYAAPDLITQRAKVSADIYSALRAKLAIYGAQVINIDMRNFAFKDSYMLAINSKVEQEQLRLAAENKLKTVEAEQKQKVAIAEAEASAVRATADGDAYARVKNATAEAEALKVQASAISSNPQVLELRRITVQQTQADRWNGQLPSAIYAGAPIIALDVTGSMGILADTIARKGLGTLFEGIIDRKPVTHPHVTHSYTGMKNVRALSAQAGITEIEPYYISRTYLTRHGAGPLPGEDPKLKFEDTTNVNHPWQGKLRFAPLDTGLRARCAADNGSPNYKLVLTHCDQVGMVSQPADHYVYGPTRDNVRNWLGEPRSLKKAVN